MQLEYHLQQSPEIILQCLTQPKHFVNTHPLIVDVEALSESEYRIKERMLYSILPMHFKYNATIVVRDHRRQVDMHAIIFGIVNISMKFQIVPEQSSTKVIETIEIKSPFVFKWIMSKVLVSQHQLWMNSIEAYQGDVQYAAI